jgi:hypothetical protein
MTEATTEAPRQPESRISLRRRPEWRGHDAGTITGDAANDLLGSRRRDHASDHPPKYHPPANVRDHLAP